jgi:hypothetical protein
MYDSFKTSYGLLKEINPDFNFIICITDLFSLLYLKQVHYNFCHMKRRTFLWLSVATTASLSIPFYSCSSTDKGLKKTLAHPQLLSHICDEKTLKDIGKTYRQTIPAEDDAIKLQELLLKSTNNTKKPEAIQSSMEQQIKRDFETNEIVVVNGWILSKTEARQCALFSII